MFPASLCFLGPRALTVCPLCTIAGGGRVCCKALLVSGLFNGLQALTMFATAMQEVRAAALTSALSQMSESPACTCGNLSGQCWPMQWLTLTGSPCMTADYSSSISDKADHPTYGSHEALITA